MEFATAFAALYAGHHVGDYWIQTDHQAGCKGKPGRAGRLACLMHVATYTLTQALCLLLAYGVTGQAWSMRGYLLALLVSAATHYAADRREYGLMFWIARKLGKGGFMRLGVPRGGHYDDNPSLGTGAWALDQSWHLFWGVFVAALILAGVQ